MSEKKKAEEKEKELTMEIQKVKDTVIRLEKVSYSMDWKHLKFSPECIVTCKCMIIKINSVIFLSMSSVKVW